MRDKRYDNIVPRGLFGDCFMQASKMTNRLNENWGEKVGIESRKSFSAKLKSGFFSRYMSGDVILDIGYRGYVSDVVPILPHAIGIDTDYPGYDGKRLPFDTNSVDAVYSSHCLEHISDSVDAIREWHRVLKVGGFLVIAVPHRDLYEKRLTLPSRWNGDHKRLYTPSVLLNEIERALAPNTYRVRELRDNDDGYDYTIGPDRHAAGGYEIEVVIEKLAIPSWSLETHAVQSAEHHSVTGVRVLEERHATRSTIQRICVLKLDHIGDFMMTVPAMRDLRARFPDAAIDLLCGSWNMQLAQSLGLFDRVFAYDFFHRNPSKPDSEAAELLPSAVLEDVYDLAIDLRAPEDTRPVLARLRARYYAGVQTTGAEPARSIVLPLSGVGPGAGQERSRSLFVAVDSTHFLPRPDAANKYYNLRKHELVYTTEPITVAPGRYRATFLYGSHRKLWSRRPILDLAAVRGSELLERRRVALSRFFDTPARLDITVADELPFSLRFGVRRGEFHAIETTCVIVERLSGSLDEADSGARTANQVHMADQAMLLVTLVASVLTPPNYGAILGRDACDSEPLTRRQDA